MTTETVLTEFHIDNIAAGLYGTRTTPQELAFARAIEQAVLQSPEVQAWKKDAERWRKAREILTVEAIETAHSDFVNFGLPPDEKENVRADDAIDAAMEEKG